MQYRFTQTILHSRQGAHYKGLAKRELIRMMDFAKIAQNPYEIDTLIRDIKNAYDIEDEELERESEEEWDD